MARRKDHTREELKRLILAAADQIITLEGSSGLTVRALSACIGYSPGTIYNVYNDMVDLKDDMNFETLRLLEKKCQQALLKTSSQSKRLPVLAHTYLDFAKLNTVRWKMIFEQPRNTQEIQKLSDSYVKFLNTMFTLIEQALVHDNGDKKKDIQMNARLLWASFHGVTTLILDGRLAMLGLKNHHKMIDQLIEKFLEN